MGKTLLKRSKSADAFVRLFLFIMLDMCHVEDCPGFVENVF